MKAQFVDPMPMPPPEKDVQLTLTLKEARILYFLSKRDLTVPNAILREYPSWRDPVKGLLHDLYRTLFTAGVRADT